MAQEFEDITSLVKRATSLFQERFKSEPTVAVCSPGRVNLIGDHVDYNGGFVLPMAIPMSTVCVGSLNKLSICRVETDSNIQGTDKPKYVEFGVPSASSPIEPGSPKWANYVKGVVAGFHDSIQGFDCLITSSIPIGAGLSSSAALEIAIYTLLEELNSTSVCLKEKALACQKAEHLFAGCPCGIMDQFICSHAQEGCALLLDCKSAVGRHVPLDDPSVCILIINSGVKHQLSGSEYPLRRAQCEKAAKSVGSSFLRDVSRQTLEENKDILESEVYRRALHVINETEHTLNFVNFLESKNYVEAGQCMIKSHKSLSELFNVSCVELDVIVEIASKLDGIYGARMTGGGFGGCAVALCDSSKTASVMQSIREQCESHNIDPVLYVCKPCQGVHRLH